MSIKKKRFQIKKRKAKSLNVNYLGFPDIQAFCPVDCSLEKDNVDLEKLREKIKDVIDK